MIVVVFFFLTYACHDKLNRVHDRHITSFTEVMCLPYTVLISVYASHL